MKKIIPALLLMAFLLPTLSSHAQKYKTAADTIRLNKEDLKLSHDINDLNAKLIIARNDLPGYQDKVKEAMKDAANAASSSSDQASKANSGKLKDAKKAKRKASKAYSQAKDAKSANKKLTDLEKKISSYESSLAKKQKRQQELVAMRAVIAGQ